MKKILTLICFFSLFMFNLAPIMPTLLNQVHAGQSGMGGDGPTLDTEKGMLDVICNVMGFVTGSVGKAFAAFAVIFMGVTFLTGKCSWTVLLMFSFGIAAIFGAPSVVNMFTGGSGGICSEDGN